MKATGTCTMIVRTAVVLAASVAAAPTLADQVVQRRALRRSLPTFSDAEANRTGPGHPWQDIFTPVPSYGAEFHDAGRYDPRPRFVNNPFSLGVEIEPVVFAMLVTQGGLNVPVMLHHNSMAAWSNPALGPKWNFSFGAFILPYIEQDGIPRMGVYWGDHREQRFTWEGNQWVPMDGYRDTLQTTPTAATLTLHDQIRLEFFAGYVARRRAYKLDRIVDTSGNAIEINHDARGRVVSATDPFGRTVTLTYNPSGRLAQVTFAYQSFSRTWQLTYVNNRLAQIEYPLVTTDAGPQTYTTKFLYDPRANIIKLADAEMNDWLYGYDLPGAPDRLRWVQPPGNTPAQRFEYKQLDPVTREFIDPIGVTSRITYDTFNREVAWTQVTTSQNSTWTTQYTDADYAWAPSIVTAPSGTMWKYDFDDRGNMVGYTSPAGHRWDYAFDQFNNLTQVLQPLVTDAWGVVEPARRRTDIVYNAQHLPTQVRRMAAPGVFNTWGIDYSLAGQVLQVTNPLGNFTLFLYDPHGNLVKLTSPEQRTYEWLYTDPEGTYGFTVPDAVRNGLMQTTQLVRDEWGRLRIKDYPSFPDEKFSWDGLSRLVRTEGGPFALPTFYTYHPFGGLFTQQRGPQLIQIARLPNGLRSAVTESGVPMPRIHQYQYGPRNELTTLIDSGAPINFAYDADGRVIDRSLPNGATASFFYLDGVLKSIVHKDAGLLPFATFSYTYQTNGQRMQADETAGGGATVRYKYDVLDRLEREQRTGAVPYDFQWTYDNADNRLTQAVNGQVVNTYVYDLDNLLQNMTTPAGMRHYAWDNARRLVQRSQPLLTEIFVHDDAGRLIHTDRIPQGQPMMPWRDFFYGALGERVMRMAFAALGQPESQTGFFDLALAPFREEKSFRGGGQTSFRPTFAGGLVRWLDANTGQCMYAATDADGSVRAWTDNAGAVGPYTAVYNSFGQDILDQGPRPPYAFAADSGVRNDGDFGWLALLSGAFYGPVEGIIVGADDAGRFLGTDYLGTVRVYPGDISGDLPAPGGTDTLPAPVFNLSVTEHRGCFGPPYGAFACANDAFGMPTHYFFDPERGFVPRVRLPAFQPRGFEPLDHTVRTISIEAAAIADLLGELEDRGGWRGRCPLGTCRGRCCGNQ